MAKADRMNRLDSNRLDLEADYTAAFTDALNVAASGKWGLFDHNKDRAARAAIAPVIENLAEMGRAIDKMRDQLSMPPFELQRQFLAARGPVDSQAVGEPKQAQAWLKIMASDGDNAG
jgi:hypothetical protein